MRHSDSKDTFETGAQRDSTEGKGRPSLISPVLIHRLGVLLEKGAKHYGADNWMKGMPYRRTADSMIRHIFQWLAGDPEEDHLAAVCFGAMCLMTYEEQPHLHCNLDDRQTTLEEILPSILTTPPKDATLQHDDDEDNKQSSIQVCKNKCGRLTTSRDGVCLSCLTYKVPRL